jgi:beta-RFAP synthase
LAIAAGLNAFHGRSWTNAAELAAQVERGLRSSVGIYGFQHGGIIIEKGKLPHEAVAPLAARDEIPDQWRVVLVTPTSRSGLCGGEEQRAFNSITPVANEVTDTLWREVESEMIPSLRSRDFDGFSDSVYRFGRAAGMCFAPVQGGPYNGPQLTEIVTTARRLGVTGVGQSSWGPTIFCFVRDEPSALDFVERMRRELSAIEANYTVARPANCGARLS